MKKLLISLFFLSNTAIAAETYTTGNITAITSIPEGLLIKLEEGNLPTVCNGHASYGWFFIPQARKTILSLTLILWTQKKTNVILYVDNNQGTNMYCTINQIQPNS
ncbi:ABC transporter ATP-binding protein [Acinetobacter guillouiae]|uniref:ABC transporter ATP-binding protein n=1 Tax=Acinetobacter guillouiae TaxID=106649 RepID=UPI003AF90595